MVSSLLQMSSLVNLTYCNVLACFDVNQIYTHTCTQIQIQLHTCTTHTHSHVQTHMHTVTPSCTQLHKGVWAVPSTCAQILPTFSPFSFPLPTFSPFSPSPPSLPSPPPPASAVGTEGEWWTTVRPAASTRSALWTMESSSGWGRRQCSSSVRPSWSCPVRQCEPAWLGWS